MNNIIHAGGEIDGNHYSNSYEAIIENIEKNEGLNITIEIDVLKIKDSYIIAHNGYENIYDYNGDFKDITLNEFNLLKVYKKYTPMNFVLLKEIVDKYNDVKFNLDIKDHDENYNNALKLIKNIFQDNLDNIVPQVYRNEDLQECLKLGFKFCMVGMWKYYDNIYSDTSIDFIKDIQEYNNICITGFSVDFKHTNNDKFNKIKNLIKSNIFLHCGDYSHDKNTIKNFNDNNLYFFL